MNLRLFSVALLVSAIPLLTLAQASLVHLDQGDFIAAERSSQNGETVVRLKLSKSGKAKFKKINELGVGHSVHAEIAGVSSDLTLRDRIRGDILEMGPYAPREADQLIATINKK